MEDIIKNIIKKNMELDENSELSFSCYLKDVNINSIKYIMIIVEMEQAFNISVDDRWLIFDEQCTLQVFVDMAKDSGAI